MVGVKWKRAPARRDKATFGTLHDLVPVGRYARSVCGVQGVYVLAREPDLPTKKCRRCAALAGRRTI